MKRTPQTPDKRLLAAIVGAHAAVAALTWRDLRTKAAWQVRGSKRAWRVASAVNTLGVAAYWLFGRRGPRFTEGHAVTTWRNR